MSGRVNVDVALVRKLIGSQFPHWASLPIRKLVPGGWDNQTFRLGDDMIVRLPSAHCYAPQVEKEQLWLPILAPELPISIPRPRALGRPGEGYAWHWSIYDWLPGDTAQHAAAEHPVGLARSLAAFLKALHAIDPAGGPLPGSHNFHRGAPLEYYDAEVRAALAELKSRVDGDRLLALWETAAATHWSAPPIWLHGDLSPANLLVDGNELSAVIDFGCCGIGDPACDLAIAWSALERRGRAAMQEALPIDRQTWMRGRAWAIWKALVTLAWGVSDEADQARWTLGQVLGHPAELE